jgi:hypothetical protein
VTITPPVVAPSFWASLLEKIKGWKSIIWHSIVVSSGGIVATLDQLKMVDWKLYLTPKVISLMLAGLGIMGIWLRIISTTSVGKSQ